MRLFLQYAASGLATGCAFALVATGFVAIYRVTRVVNFAQGVFAVLAGMMASTLLAVGVPHFAAEALAVVAAVVAGALVGFVAIGRRGTSPLASLIITLGLGIGSFHGTLRTFLFPLGLYRETLLFTLEAGFLTLLFEPLVFQFSEEASFPPDHSSLSVSRNSHGHAKTTVRRVGPVSEGGYGPGVRRGPAYQLRSADPVDRCTLISSIGRNYATLPAVVIQSATPSATMRIHSATSLSPVWEFPSSALHPEGSCVRHAPGRTSMQQE